MTLTTVAPLAAGTTDADGTTVTSTLDGGLRDTNRRLPAFLALSQLGHGRYAENLDGLNVDAALKAAGLDFTVIKHEGLGVPGLDDGPQITGLDHMRGAVAHFNDDRPPTLLGVVGASYEVVQPGEAALFGQAVVDEGGATIVAAGAYGKPVGSRMYLALKLPKGLTVGGEDPHDLYMSIINSFNRSTGLAGVVAPIRLDCTNQAAVTFGSMSNRISLRHTIGVTNEVAEARRMLKLANTFTTMYREFAETLLASPMVGNEIDEFVNKIMPTPGSIKTDRGEQNWADKRNVLSYTIRSGERNTVGRGTRYAAYQGLVEWTDWMSEAKSPLSRAARALDGGQYEELKVQAGRLLTAGL